MIHCIGVGPGDPDYLTLKARDLIATADVVAGFDYVVDLVGKYIRAEATVIKMGYKDQVAQLEKAAALHHEGRCCAVVFMGDVHFSGFQFLERVDRACGERVPTVPGISSAQVMASKGRVCFDETTFVTFHRRGDIEPFKRHLVQVLKDGRNAIVIPLPWDFMPADIAAYLVEQGVPAHQPVEVWEKLTQNEAEWTGTLGECRREFSDISIMLIRSLAPFPSQVAHEYE